MGRSLIASIAFHVALALLVVGVASLSRDLPVAETPITVEIVTGTAESEPSPLPPKPAPAQAAPKPPRQAATPAPPPPPPKVEPKPEAEPEAEPEPPPPAPVAETAPEPPPPPPKTDAPEPESAPEPRKAEAAAPPAPKPERPKPAPAKPAEAPEPKREKPVQVAKAEPKPERPPTPPVPKQEESDFEALLRSVERTPRRVQAPEKREGKGPSAVAGGTGQPGRAQVAQINPSVLAATISRQITPCWNIPVAAQGAGGLRAELNIVMAPDGGVQSVVPVDAARMGNDPVFRAFAESAVRAVRSCSPLKLPPESYQVWRNIIFNFDPSLMTG
jgi:outer membrane biosynthesis protein TonB